MNEIFCSIFSQHLVHFDSNSKCSGHYDNILNDAHSDWLNLCAHETTQSVRSDFLPSVKMVQSFKVLLMVPMLPT